MIRWHARSPRNGKSQRSKLSTCSRTWPIHRPLTAAKMDGRSGRVTPNGTPSVSVTWSMTHCSRAEQLSLSLVHDGHQPSRRPQLQQIVTVANVQSSVRFFAWVQVTG